MNSEGNPWMTMIDPDFERLGLAPVCTYDFEGKNLGDVFTYIEQNVTTMAEGHRFMDAWRAYAPYAADTNAEYHLSHMGGEYERKYMKLLSVRRTWNTDDSRNH